MEPTRVTLVILAILSAVPVQRAAAACSGDCNGDGRVVVSELVRAVGVALGNSPLSQCTAADSSGDGSVSIAELIGAVGSALRSCNPAPTRTPPPTATRAPDGTPTASVPGCDNGTFDVTYTATTAGNYVTSPVTLDLVAAGQVRNPAAPVYLWGITGLQCMVNMPTFTRAVQVQLFGPSTGFAPGTYAVTPPLSSIVYQESTNSSASSVRAWDTAGGTLTIEEVDGDRLRFRIAAPMKPQPLLSIGETPQGTFTLEVSGTVEHFTSQ